MYVFLKLLQPIKNYTYSYKDMRLVTYNQIFLSVATNSFYCLLLASKLMSISLFTSFLWQIYPSAFNSSELYYIYLFCPFFFFFTVWIVRLDSIKFLLYVDACHLDPRRWHSGGHSSIVKNFGELLFLPTLTHSSKNA